MLELIISDNRMLKLDVENENIQRFSMCELSYIEEDNSINIYEDYLYTFIDSMLGRIKKIPVLHKNSLFGKLG